MNQELKKTKVVSDELGVNPTTVQRWIKNFNIPYETNDLGHYLLAEKEIELYLRSLKEQLNEGLTMKEIYNKQYKLPKNDNIKSIKTEEMIETAVFLRKNSNN
ncbi:MerR family transcriptional regulator [Anaerobacillus sp. HL2]|nr:MerR family transcriptional regulator [Anaerobacillus sp. HL2]